MQYVFLTLMTCALGAAPVNVEIPRAVDPRLKIELFVAEPDLVTPTGIAVDAEGRVLVIECHTHFRPKEYAGPAADRIRMMADTDGDGRADRITTFFEGTQSTMNLAIFRDGSLYVATRNEVFRLRDTDGDGKADERTPIVRLETTGNYPHNGLSGFAFDFADHVYFGMGENLGVEYKLVGSDGASISGREGGHIFRCDRDGSHVVRWATGFWNPFHLAFDVYERLFAVDNDPDSVPPCRLLHVVEGGNYGYKFRNGRKGLHPFTAWNGELPGTLPMVAGTGEAPSGILAYESDNLPDEYRGDLLVTSWGDHRIERYRLAPQGASFRSQMQPVIIGGENFRPVGIALAPDGSLYISDWVDKSYPLHGKGRVWRISSVEAKKPVRPHAPKEAIKSAHRPLREQAARQLAEGGKEGIEFLKKVATEGSDVRVRATSICAVNAHAEGHERRDVFLKQKSLALRALSLHTEPKKASEFENAAWFDANEELIAELLRTTMPVPDGRPFDIGGLFSASFAWQKVDPFVWQAARLSVGRGKPDEINAIGGNEKPSQRLSRLLVLRESGSDIRYAKLDERLADADPWVRFLAVQWIGEEKLTQFRDDLSKVLSAGPLTERLFSAYLAALERLDGAARGPKDEWSSEQYVLQALLDAKTPAEARRWALRMLPPDHPALTLDRLKKYLTGDDPQLRVEALRTLRDSPLRDKSEVLMAIVRDKSVSNELRLEALVGLAAESDDARKLLLEIAQGPDDTARAEALRSLRGAQLNDAERQQLAKVVEQHPDAAELVRRVLEPAVVPTDRPKPEDLAWNILLFGPADPTAGERIFYHAKSASCARCHQHAGRGGRIGPDLTTARLLGRERLIDSILRPSKEIAPMFVPWNIETTDGRVLAGMLVSQAVNGELTFANEKGELFRLKPGEIENRRPSPKSIMPDGLADILTVQEFRDLVAFLLKL